MAQSIALAATRRLRDVTYRVGACAAGAIAIDQVGRYACHSPISEAQNQETRDALSAPERSWTDGVALEQLAQLLAAERDWRLAGEHGGEVALCQAVRNAVGHSLRCGSSNISGGGDGVFASGNIPKGRVLSVFAGDYFTAWESLFHGVCRTLFKTGGVDGYMIRQADGSVIDGSTQTASAQRQAMGYVNPSACSQLANHPPGGTAPNAGFLAVYVPLTAVFPNLPVFHWWGAAIGQFQVATLLVSLVDIENGHELFVDYKMDGPDLPNWYVKCQGSHTSIEGKWNGPSLKEYLDFHEVL